MKWYSISYDEWPASRGKSFSDLSDALLYTPDKDLIEFQDFSVIGDYEIEKGFDVRDLPFIYFQIKRKKNFRVGDCLGYQVRESFVFSEKFMSCLSLNNLTVDSGVIQKPLRIVDKSFNPVAGLHYTVLWQVGGRECLDINRSDIEYYPSVPGLILKVHRFVLVASQIPDCHIFRLDPPGCWLASEEVVKSSHLSSCEGISFDLICEN